MNAALQAAGVASGVSAVAVELLKDAQLHARLHPASDRAFIGPPSHVDAVSQDRPFRSKRAATDEHTREILGEKFLGLSEAESISSQEASSAPKCSWKNTSSTKAKAAKADGRGGRLRGAGGSGVLRR
jgi:hypothetical protein